MSMSKPSICPVNGLRAPNSSVSPETPTISRPRSLISAIVLPAGNARPPAADPAAGTSARRGRARLVVGALGRDGGGWRAVDASTTPVTSLGSAGVAAAGDQPERARSAATATDDADRGSSVLPQSLAEADDGQHGRRPDRRAARARASAPSDDTASSNACGRARPRSARATLSAVSAKPSNGRRRVAAIGDRRRHERDGLVPVPVVVERRGPPRGDAGSRRTDVGAAHAWPNRSHAESTACRPRCSTAATAPRTPARCRG